ncbi:MAG: hypothetical protein M1820_008627 [Bogoriella megaspora]|nr:MAG: hypothetical protein M1820_008627 [Bogoriella megaspora]
MALCDAWLETVLKGDDYEPLPDPQIPADYLQKPLRQHPASEQSQLLLPPHCSKLKRKHAALSEISPPNNRRPSEQPSIRQPMPNAVTPTMPPAPRPSSNRAQAKKAVNTNEASEKDAVDPNSTPRPVRITRRTVQPPAAADMPNTILDETSTPAWARSASGSEPDMSGGDTGRSLSSVTQSTDSKARSRSPTKRMVDLRVAEKTLIPEAATKAADVPEDVRGLYRAIRSLAHVPRNVIPLGIEDEVKKDADGDLDDLDLLVSMEANAMDREQLMDEFKALRGVRDSTAFCKTKYVNEPTWNERVHSRLLEQAINKRPGFEYHYITTARVIRELVPGTRHGEILKNKMIDYAIVLGSPLLSEDQLITRLATSPRPLQRTINPSDYSPLRYNPVAISIETKSPGGQKEDGTVQLSIWAMAYFNRLRMLTQDPVPITLPLILISDEHWKLMFARDLEDSIRIIDAVDFGDTGDIVGCYKILAALRILCDWAQDNFLKLVSERVLEPE